MALSLLLLAWMGLIKRLNHPLSIFGSIEDQIRVHSESYLCQLCWSRF